MKRRITDDRWIKIWNIEDKFVFKVYPRNNKNQEMGTSTEYATYDECDIASKEFVCFILRNVVKDKTSKYIQYEQYKDDKNCWHYRYICKDDSNGSIFYQRYVGNKSSAHKGITSLYNTLEKAYGESQNE